MRRLLDQWLTPALALWVLATVGVTTLAAVRRGDVWRGRARDLAFRLQNDPYVEVERSLADAGGRDLGQLRNPFALGAPPAAAKPSPRPRPRPPQPPEPEPPRLTAIVWSAEDPRAVVWWSGRSYSLRAGQTFESFRVVSIGRDRVVLEQAGKSITLAVERKGE